MWQLHPDATELGFVFSYILSRPENCNRDPNVERVNGFHFSSGLSLGTLGRRAKPADRAEILNSIEFFLYHCISGLRTPLKNKNKMS